MDDSLMWDWVAGNVSPLTGMGKALWRGAALAWKWHLVRRITLCYTGGPLLAVSSVGVSDGPLVTHGQVLCPPPCPTEWWSVCLVGQARNWESPLTPPSGLPPCPLHPHSLPALPLRSLWSPFSAPHLRHNHPRRGYQQFPLEPCHSLLSALVLALLQAAIHSATSWLGTLKFKTLQNLFLKWLLLLG